MLKLIKPKLNYARYLVGKPWHSAKHKKIKKIADKLAYDQKFYESVLKELAEYTKEDLVNVEKQYKNLCDSVAKMKFDHLTEDQLNDFYKSAQHYLYELPIWNAATGRIYYFSQLLVPYFKSQKYKDILDFGAGAGDLCLGLAKHSFNMYYTDINEKLKEFARWRFERNMLKIEILDQKKLEIKKFDCVVSFDVFEHFKNLPQKIKELSALIKKDGGLIFNIEISGDGLHLAENKIYSDSKKLDKLLNENGLYFHWRFKKIYFYKKR